MIRSTVVALVVTLLALQAAGQAVKQVEVTNFPDSQNVVGQVEVTNLPTCESPARFVGYSAASFDGSAGIVPLHGACRDSFGADARMCSSAQVLDTLDWPAVGSTQFGWLSPVLILNTGMGQSIDVSGAQGGGGNLSCHGWAVSGVTATGLVVYGNGSFRTLTCNVSQPVACCASAP